MKTPDEIKKGLSHCIGVKPCIDCDYDNRDFPKCIIHSKEDALAYIQQLETNNHQLIEKIEQLEAHVPSWISVKEMLPERDKEVLCFFVYPDQTTVCQNVYYGGGHWLGEGSFVTHWMPLPEPPKEVP